MKSKEIPERDRAKEAAKERKPSRAVKKSIDKVKRRVESDKPGPETDRVTTDPDTNPAH